MKSSDNRNNEGHLEKLDILKQSPIFAISRAGVELAHSNFWEWLIRLRTENGQHPYLEIFISSFYDNSYEFLNCYREKKKTDLLIEYRNSKGEKCAHIIENKIKTIPYTEQLRNYEGAMVNGYSEVKGTLTGLSKTLNIVDSDSWSFISYEAIGEKILDTTEQHADLDISSFTRCFIKQYANEIILLSNIIRKKLKETAGKYIFGDSHLNEIKFSDIFVKLKGVEFVKELTELISKDKTLNLSEVTKKNWVNPVVELSFNHKSSTITAVYRETDGEEEKGRIGVQIEGKQFRVYGGASKEGIIDELEVKKILYDYEYLVPDFRKKYDTAMRKEYCKYATKEYCHLYQHRTIHDFDYRSLSKAVLEQLKIAKQKIEDGITFNYI